MQSQTIRAKRRGEPEAVKRKLRYTKVPRTILWLIEGGSSTRSLADGTTEAIEVDSFYLGKFPITNQQFEAFDPEFERLGFSPGDRDPALGVSWRRADAYCQWYSEVARKPMRLATEEEWEWACRADRETGTYFRAEDAGDYVWSLESSPTDRIPLLDGKKANPAGLWGMLGGVWDWTSGSEVAESGAEARRVLRGGSYRSRAADLTSKLRRLERADIGIEDAGFRVAKSLRSP